MDSLVGRTFCNGYWAWYAYEGNIGIWTHVWVAYRGQGARFSQTAVAHIAELRPNVFQSVIGRASEYAPHETLEDAVKHVEQEATKIYLDILKECLTDEHA